LVLLTRSGAEGNPRVRSDEPEAGPLLVREAAEPKPKFLTGDKIRELWFADRVLKSYNRAAPNQERVLACFEEAGWPERVEAPFKGNKLSCTIKDLNDALGMGSSIGFRLDGAGGVCWYRKSLENP
jgi:hypothetical protein